MSETSLADTNQCNPRSPLKSCVQDRKIFSVATQDCLLSPQDQDKTGPEKVCPRLCLPKFLQVFGEIRVIFGVHSHQNQKLEKAVAVSRSVSGIPEENSGKSLENYGKHTDHEMLLIRQPQALGIKGKPAPMFGSKFPRTLPRPSKKFLVKDTVDNKNTVQSLLTRWA